MSQSAIITVEIVNEKGLHARASAKFVDVVEAHKSSATVHHLGQHASGDSIMGLLMLAAARGAKINIQAQGDDAEALVNALEVLVADRFGEPM